MRVLITGAGGRCGTAITDHLSESGSYEFTLLDRSTPAPDHPHADQTIITDVVDLDAVTSAMDGHDAVVHLAAYPHVDSTWSDVHEPNIVGQYNVLEAARRCNVESFVFASTNHVVGMYEVAHRPDLYESGYGLVVDHTVPVRPDSFYGASKAFGEALGRLYIERQEAPERFYALRIGNVTAAAEDDPAAFATRKLRHGADPSSATFRRAVKRRMAMWLSRRDFAHLVDRCLQDETVTFDVFFGVSDNRNRWFDLEHARATLGYRPRDRAEDRPIPWEGLGEDADS